jgi:hypothetical protein
VRLGSIAPFASSDSRHFTATHSALFTWLMSEPLPNPNPAGSEKSLGTAQLHFPSPARSWLNSPNLRIILYNNVIRRKDGVLGDQSTLISMIISVWNKRKHHPIHWELSPCRSTLRSILGKIWLLPPHVPKSQFRQPHFLSKR